MNSPAKLHTTVSADHLDDLLRDVRWLTTAIGSFSERWLARIDRIAAACTPEQEASLWQAFDGLVNEIRKLAPEETSDGRGSMGDQGSAG